MADSTTLLTAIVNIQPTVKQMKAKLDSDQEGIKASKEEIIAQMKVWREENALLGSRKNRN
jgi:hypothetical protein